MKLKERVILHCDANNFFASCECLDKPELLSQPVAVSGNPAKRTGIILAKNEIAKKAGVCTGEPIWQAKQKCPQLVCLPPHHEFYQTVSDRLKNIYLTYTDHVESFGIDECWLDVTDSQKLFGDGMQIAETIRKRVKSEIGITVSIGVSFCKIFAKLGSDMKKPDAITQISKQDYKKMTYNLPLTDVIGFGRRLSATLSKTDIKTIGDFVNTPTEYIQRKMGIVGVQMKEKLSGYDFDPVLVFMPLPKSVGNGTTTIVDIQTKEEISNTIAFLCDKISARLRKNNFSASTIGVTLKTSEFKHFHHDTKMPYFTNDSLQLHQNALALVDTFWNYDQKVRSVTVRTANLKQTSDFQQQSMFENPKIKGLGFGIDQLRQKYGKGAITLASNLTSTFIDGEKD